MKHRRGLRFGQSSAGLEDSWGAEIQRDRGVEESPGVCVRHATRDQKSPREKVKDGSRYALAGLQRN